MPRQTTANDPYKHIPNEFYREAWEDAEHPQACVNLENRFERVNSAFERLLGYSNAELEGRQWTEITDQKHVGGDLASVQQVIDGKQESYRMEKDYIHKRGHRVPVVLIVRRYPKSNVADLAYFRVEAPIATATRTEIQEVENHAQSAIAQLKAQLDQIKQGVNVQVGNSISGKGNSGDVVGRDKTTNSDKTIKILIGGFAVMVICMAWLMYYVATTTNNQPVQPPAISTPQ